MNIRKCSRSASPKTNRLSTTREIQWKIAGFITESFQGAKNRALLMGQFCKPNLPEQVFSDYSSVISY